MVFIIFLTNIVTSLDHTLKDFFTLCNKVDFSYLCHYKSCVLFTFTHVCVLSIFFFIKYSINFRDDVCQIKHFFFRIKLDHFDIEK